MDMNKVFGLLMVCLLSFNMAWAQEERIPAKGFAVDSKEGHFHPYDFTRHAVGDNDILIEILYAGICHSDLSSVWSEHGKSNYPMVPGHEIVGRVIATGKNVSKFKTGDYAGVGCMVNSCGECADCKADMEQSCQKGPVFTYGFHDPYHDNEITMGGYSNNIVVSEDFAITVPAGADIKRVAPLLCAGVTTWSPLHYSNVKKGDKVGVAGFGGLGHMAVQYAVRLGAEVTVFDITEEKRDDAARLGAVRYVNVNNSEDLKGLDNSFDFIISTIPLPYEPFMYVKMLKKGGDLAIVGLPENSTLDITAMAFQAPNRRVYASFIGGIKETQEMLDFSIANNIYPEVEVIKADAAEIENAYKSVLDGKVKFRYVIDMSTMDKK